jgi:1,4-dihydroxy-2-naphthoate octaprenyltransferase
VFVALRYTSLWNLLFLLTMPFYIKHLRGVWKRHGHDLDPMLPLLVISTFLLALLMGVGFLLG